MAAVTNSVHTWCEAADTGPLQRSWPEAWNLGIGGVLLPLRVPGKTLDPLLEAPGDPWPWPHHSGLCLCGHTAASSSSCLVSSEWCLFSNLATPPAPFPPYNPGWSLHFKILNWKRSENTTFPNKVQFSGSRRGVWTYLLRATDPPPARRNVASIDKKAKHKTKTT